MLWKKIILKGKKTTIRVEHKQKNTGTRVLIHPGNVTLKTVSLKASFGHSIEMWSQFSRLVGFNWVK